MRQVGLVKISLAAILNLSTWFARAYWEQIWQKYRLFGWYEVLYMAGMDYGMISKLDIVDTDVEQTRGQRQTGHNDLPGKGERVAKWMVIVKSKKC